MSSPSPAITSPGFALPELSRDFDFFMTGLREHRFLVQHCSGCGTVRHPPGPVCAACGSLEWTTQALKDSGTVYSYTVHHHPPIPPYETPHPVVLVDMDDGPRVVAALHGCSPEDIVVGMRVELEFVEVANGFTLHRFRPQGE
jgi:uncharacterized OB-fold protein